MGDLAVVDGEDGMGCKVGCEGGMLTTFLSGRSVGGWQRPGVARGATRNFLGNDDWSHLQLCTMQRPAAMPASLPSLPAFAKRGRQASWTAPHPNPGDMFSVNQCLSRSNFVWLHHTPLVSRKELSHLVRLNSPMCSFLRPDGPYWLLSQVVLIRRHIRSFDPSIAPLQG